MLTKQQRKQNNMSKKAYVGFLYQSFFKRPFGYVVAVLYVVYLAIILLIVPACLHFQPLFIWNVGGFNMPMFNLFFIAASTASAAVAIFRTGIDDGTELNLSSKPLTKRSRVLIKTFVFLSVMLMFCLISLIITVLIKPIFGTYDILFNPTGIANDKYIGIILSVLIGNIINMLFFGGFSVLISMIGGQVIIMIGTIGIAFVMCLLNVIFPLAVSSPLKVLRDKYNTSINSYSCNTLNQFNQKDTPHKNFAAIQCITEEDGTEISHFDTKEYWTKANAQSGRSITNYVDFAKQLSSLYSIFGLDKSKLEEASKLSIGTNNAYKYHIIGETHVKSLENIVSGEYPIAIYDTTSSQGIMYPVVNILGGNMGIEKNNWYARSTLTGTNFDAVFMASRSHTSFYSSSLHFRGLFTQPWFRMSDLTMTQNQIDVAKNLFINQILTNEEPGWYSGDKTNPFSAHYIIVHDDSGAFFPAGGYYSLSAQEKLKIMTQIALVWVITAQVEQIKLIDDYCAEEEIADSFPYSSKTIKSWWYDTVISKTGEKHESLNFYKQMQIRNTIRHGIWIDSIPHPTTGEEIEAYTMPIRSDIEYCETYSNLYQYQVTSVYNIYALICVWALISAGLFTTSIVVYRKTDFK